MSTWVCIVTAVETYIIYCIFISTGPICLFEHSWKSCFGEYFLESLMKSIIWRERDFILLWSSTFLAWRSYMDFSKLLASYSRHNLQIVSLSSGVPILVGNYTSKKNHVKGEIMDTKQQFTVPERQHPREQKGWRSCRLAWKQLPQGSWESYGGNLRWLLGNETKALQGRRNQGTGQRERVTLGFLDWPGLEGTRDVQKLKCFSSPPRYLLYLSPPENVYLTFFWNKKKIQNRKGLRGNCSEVALTHFFTHFEESLEKRKWPDVVTVHSGKSKATGVYWFLEKHCASSAQEQHERNKARETESALWWATFSPRKC